MRDTAVILSALCFLMLGSSVLTAPPSLNELYPRSLPGATGNVLLEGSNFGNSSTAVNVTFRVGNNSYSACSYKELLKTSVAEYINCTLSNTLPYPGKFNVTVVHQTNGTSPQTVSFETGITNQPPSVTDFQITQPEDTTFTITLPAGTDGDAPYPVYGEQT